MVWSQFNHKLIHYWIKFAVSSINIIDNVYQKKIFVYNVRKKFQTTPPQKKTPLNGRNFVKKWAISYAVYLTYIYNVLSHRTSFPMIQFCVGGTKKPKKCRSHCMKVKVQHGIIMEEGM